MTIPKWQTEARAALAPIVEPDEWVTDEDGFDMTREDCDCESPGWTVSSDGERIELNTGSADFAIDVVDGDILKTARWLLKAAATRPDA